MTHRELRAMIRHLSDCQVDRLGQMASRFLALKQELAETKPVCCPVCGDENAAFIRKGFQNGKQRFQCKSCGHKFTYDTDRLTSGSHQPLESWVTLIGDTLALRSLDATAKAIGVSHSTAFNMRHKLLVYLEQVTENMPPLEAVIEADETYVLESQKGTPVTHRAPRKHGEGASRRGLSNEQLCVCVATDREHHVAARCVNRAKPSSEDLVKALGNHSAILCDGTSSCNLLAEKTGCEKVSLIGHENYSKVYHLNMVNALHSRFKEMMRRYRGVATKYLNRCAVLLPVASMSAALSENEAVDLVRRDIGAIRLHLTGKAVKCLEVLEV